MITWTISGDADGLSFGWTRTRSSAAGGPRTVASVCLVAQSWTAAQVTVGPAGPRPVMTVNCDNKVQIGLFVYSAFILQTNIFCFFILSRVSGRARLMVRAYVQIMIMAHFVFTAAMPLCPLLCSIQCNTI